MASGSVSALTLQEDRTDQIGAINDPLSGETEDAQKAKAMEICREENPSRRSWCEISRKSSVMTPACESCCGGGVIQDEVHGMARG